MMQAQPTVKRSFFLFLALAVIPFFGIGQNAEALYRIKTIVIDAGHGGKDPGNLGTGRYKTQEKDIALEVALRVGEYIGKQFPEINIVYTRKTDVFIGLNERADKANKIKADLFLSIHCNAFSNPESNGVETWVLGLHRNKENLQVAMKENSAIFLEDDYKTKYEGFDPNSAESIIALTIMQSAYLQQSLAISSYIQSQFKNRVGRRDRGVKQAGFLVLRKTTMPSILIELGFLTHAPEEDFLNTENGKAYMSSAIFRGFKKYKETVEDPLPEGYFEPVKELEDAAKEDEQTDKQVELDAAMKEAKKTKQDSIAKVEAQAKIKVVSDSLEQRKQQLLEEKKKKEEELAIKAEEDRKANIQARIDSLQRLKEQKIANFEKQKVEEAARKAKEEAERLAKVEKDQKELESKEVAKEWLEEIKEVKEQELADAKKKVEVEEEEKRLEQIKTDKQKELEIAKALKAVAEKSKSDSVSATKLIDEQARLDSIRAAAAKVKKEALLAKTEKDKKELAFQDSIMIAEAESQVGLNKLEKARQDSIWKAKNAASKVTLDVKNATTAGEAELLFLQLRKKQLEQRIASLKNQDVDTRNLESLPRPKTSTQTVSDSAVLEGQKKGVGLILKVQVITSAQRLDKSDPILKGQAAWEYQQSGLYKYTVGATDDFEDITKLHGELIGLGFKGAFVVAFNNGKRIKVSEARELLKSSE